MTSTSATSSVSAASASRVGGTAARGMRGAYGAAIVRILFGLLWGIDALFKWMPGFVDGQTLPDELGGAAKVQVPLEHQWLQLWNSVGLANPSLFAHGIAIVESIVAILIITGLFTRVALIAATLLALGIWTGAEGMHMPWFTPGQTDLGPSVGYIFASLGLLFAGSARVWSLDALFAKRAGRYSWLFSSPSPSGR